MSWRQPGEKPLSEPMMVRLPTYICVNRPQWVKIILHNPPENKQKQLFACIRNVYFHFTYYFFTVIRNYHVRKRLRALHKMSMTIMKIFYRAAERLVRIELQYPWYVIHSQSGWDVYDKYHILRYNGHLEEWSVNLMTDNEKWGTHAN